MYSVAMEKYSKTPSEHKTVCQVAEWIECHLHQPISVSQLTHLAGCSSRHLRGLFKQAFGVSIRTYIQKRRLTLASSMLRETSRTLTEVAMMYQFSHLSSFSRAFKNQFGQCPHEYQQSSQWDMRLFYPSAVVDAFSTRTDIVSIPENTGIAAVSKIKKTLHFGFDFYLTTENGQIVSRRDFYNQLIPLIFREKQRYPLTVGGETLPGKECDTHINIFLGNLIFDATPEKCIIIPSGDYACFSVTESPLNIMRFHAWVKGHGMHESGLIMKKGMTFSIFNETSVSGIYKTKYYIPCVIP